MDLGIQCALCQKHNVRLIGENADLKIHFVYLCKQCGFMFTQPVPSEQELEVIYKEEYRNIRSEAPTHEYRHFMLERAEAQYQFISESIKSGIVHNPRLVIDIGCGAGMLLRKFESSGAQVIGFEPDSMMAKEAKSNLSDIATVHSSLYRPELLDSVKVDLICISHVLEHIGDPIKFLSSLKNILNPNGTIFIEVPAETIGGVWEQCAHHARGLMHLVYFTPKTIRIAAHLAGFRVLSIECYGSNRWLNTVVHPRIGILWRRLVYYPLRALEKLSLANNLVLKVFRFENSIEMLHYRNPRGSYLRCMLYSDNP